jgi:DNA helicase HerA-like ATPase
LASSATTPQIDDQVRLDVIDLISIPDKNTRELIINAILSQEWERARILWQAAMNNEPHEDPRVPTFIVVDEAHNFMPSNPRSRGEIIIREQFRTIAAEGRKYGLFLLLVSQRPDKLDDFVLSECGNKAIMRLDSEGVAKVVREKLGLEGLGQDFSHRMLQFKKSRALLAGQWANPPMVMFCAARRTKEGGRSLGDAWTFPFETKPKKE